MVVMKEKFFWKFVSEKHMTVSMPLKFATEISYKSTIMHTNPVIIDFNLLIYP